MLPEAMKKYTENVDKLRKDLQELPKVFPDMGELGGR